MSDISLDIDSSQVATAKKALGSLTDAWARMANKIVADNKRIDSAVKASSQVHMLAIDKMLKAEAKQNSNAWFERQRRKTSMIKASALLEQKVAADAVRAATKEQAAAAALAATDARLAAEKTKLTHKYNIAGSAAIKFAASQKEIKRAGELNVITLDQQKAALGRLTREYQSYKAGTAGWNNQFVSGAQRGGRSMNRFGMYAQQVGYQVGDFFVQVQSGQNAMVAFAQQGTQLAGLLPGVAGAIVGISLSLGGMIYQMLRSRKSTKELGKEAKETKTYMEGLTDQINLLNSAFENQEELNLYKAEREATKEYNKALVELTAAKKAFDDLVATNPLMGRSDIPSPESLQNTANRNAVILATEEVALKKEALDAAISLREEIERRNTLSEAELKIAESYADFMRDKALQQLLDNKAAQDELATLKEKNALLVAESIYTKDSAEYLNLVQQYERDSLEARIKSEGLVGDIAEGLRKSLEYAQGIAQLDMAGGIDMAAASAAQLAAQFGLAYDKAFALSRIEQSTGAKLGFGGVSPISIAGTSGTKFKFPSNIPGGGTTDVLAPVKILDKVTKAAKGAAAATEKLTEAQKTGLAITEKYLTPLEKYTKGMTELNDLLKQGEISTTTYERAMQDLNDTLAESNPLVNDLSNAFGDFVAGGLKDFKGFVDSIKNTFKKALSDMIATALRNRIMIPIQTAMMGGSGGVGGIASSVLGGGGGMGGMLGGIGGTLGSLGSIFAGSAGSVLSAFGSGGISGAIGQASLAMSGATASFSGFAAAAGAAIPFIGAAALAIGFFSSKTKKLDEGISLTANGMSVAVQQFEKIKKTRFFGLSSRTRTSSRTASSDVANPLTSAIGGMQSSVMSMANAIGVGSNAFSRFSYSFKLSLKGLTEEQQMTKINEELVKMGDSFAALVPGISSMAELTAVYQERLGLETRLLQLQGNTAALRKIELASVNDYNKAILLQIYATEDKIAAEQRATELLGLQGNVVELRKREMEALDPTLRGLQMAIYKFEDMQRVLDDIDPVKFATKFQYELAQSRASNFIPTGNFSNVNLGVGAPVVLSDPQTNRELVTLRTTVENLLIRIEDNTGQSYRLERKWDRDGLPPERV